MKNQSKTKCRYVIISLAVIFLVFSVTPMGQDFVDLIAESLDLQVNSEEEYPLNIYFLSVGKADAIVIACEDEYALLDSGTFDRSEEVEVVLRRLGIDKLKLAVASHPDSDHIGGFSRLLKSFAAEQFVQPNFPDQLVTDNAEQQQLETTLKELALPITKAQAGDKFQLGTATIEVLGPVEEYAETNNYSLVLKLQYKDFSALFCGDIEAQAEVDLLATDVDLRADCIKIAHHGSKTSSTAEFLSAVQAKYAVVSTGADSNKLPRSEVLKRIEALGAEIYRTDLDGKIQVSSNGEETIIKAGKAG
ncbi:ComEC/Rec2 family competence protein [Scatolibacter rhodanostii]|uniref:ComEC/Rec2 family competence protein n=1 Tax=Scatolibacter rhodanostii TaxID=2014781 RepID=UPI000C07EA80|nr:ComEC/Rec2 family competence protein [Scatolibacter rhodanostii]